MPTSHHYQISKIVDIIYQLRPQSVLDIGVGFGKYGVLCREYLDLWDGTEKYEFKARIDGIEAFANYLTPLHDYIYNEIKIGNALELVPQLERRYDMVLLIDVLEHFEKEAGRQLIHNILAKHGGVIISTPNFIGTQGASFENEFEHHVSQWSRQDLAAFGPHLFVSDASSFIVYLGAETKVKELKKKYYYYSLKKLVGSLPGAYRLKKLLYR